ncbi:MAG: ABC transporter ATP-binding protein [Lachnospiraceae bacterium]|nr:ABC transporter ATP-binding protein [Lachnospiraceae bacterium]
MEYALQIEHLKKTYPGFSLKDISLQLPKGNIMGLIGENGAGKSTTIKAILDLIQKDGGEIKILGRSMETDRKTLNEEIGVVFDTINFNETLTPKQVGKICGNSYRNWDIEQYKAYLEKFRLPEGKQLKTFSKGMQVKLCIAVALSHHAKILLLDEATSGLDPVMRDEILDIFLEFVQDEEHSILVSSHITSDLEKVADYIAFLKDGQILLSEPKDRLIYQYGILRCKNGVFEQMDRGDILAYRKMDYQYEVLVADKKAAEKKYRDAVVDTATLEEIMLLYIKGEFR